MNEPATEPEHKRRWFQYSIRSLMLVTLVIACWLGYITNEARKQKEVVEWVRKNNGIVYYDYQLDEDGLVIVNSKPPGPDWLREWIGIDYICNVEMVFFTAFVIRNSESVTSFLGDIETTELAPIYDFTHLRWIVFEACSPSKKELQKLQDAFPQCGIRWFEAPFPEKFWCKKGCNEWHDAHDDPHSAHD